MPLIMVDGEEVECTATHINLDIDLPLANSPDREGHRTSLNKFSPS